MKDTELNSILTHFHVTSWDNGIKQKNLSLQKVQSLPEILFLCSEHTHSEWLFWYESPCTLLLIWMGTEDAHASCWNQDSGMGTTHNEGKTPCPGNSDSAVQSLLCYLPRAIYSHEIFHSVRDMARKSPANPKVLQSYNNHRSTPSSTKGAQQSSCWPAWDKLYAIHSST